MFTCCNGHSNAYVCVLQHLRIHNAMTGCETTAEGEEGWSHHTRQCQRGDRNPGSSLDEEASSGAALTGT